MILLYCKYCGAPADDDAVFCSACGRSLAPPVQTDAASPAPAGEPEENPDFDAGFAIPELSEEDAEPEEPVGSSGQQAGIYYDNLQKNRQEAAAAAEAGEKKTSRKALIAIAAVLVCAAVILVLAFVLPGLSDSSDTVVMTCAEQDFSLTNAELSYYYWSEYYYLLSYYGDYLSYYTGLDTSVALDEQSYSDSMTWDDYFTQAALSAAQETMAFVFAAEEEGYTLSADYQESLDTTLENFETYAVEYGFTDADGNADVQAYLEDSYGEGSSYDTFVEYLTYSYICASYSSDLYNNQTYTEEEVSAYYDTYADEYEAAGVDKTTRLVNVRHILIECDMDDEEAAAEALAQAEEILATWQEEDGTEEGFAALAEEYSADTGSNTNGGLYEDVYPGEMVTNFNDWCFDADREAGDTGIVESDYGYHIMYLSGFGDEYWYLSALADLCYENYSNAYYSIVGSYTFEVNEDAIVIGTPTSYSVG